MQATPQTIEDINLLSSYLSAQQIPDLTSSPPVDTIVICASAIHHQAEHLFEELQRNPSITKSLVLCGGIGHSTQFIYEAVAQHPRFSSIAEDINGLPEARVLDAILTTFFDKSSIISSGCRVLVEDKSTNCGANATLSKNVLDDASLHSKTCIIIQDPTMMRRTIASFEKAYENTTSPQFIGYPVFTPQVQLKDGLLEYSAAPERLWPHPRFLELLLGEIPRLCDDEGGYGPRGKGFLPHVDVPVTVQEAWNRLKNLLDVTR